jgi:predicted ferric reductase
MAYQDIRTGSSARHWTRQLPLPRVWPITSGDILAVLVANAVIIVGMWLRHGGLDQMGTPAGVAIAVGQLTALLGTYLALVQVVLMSRSPWLERVLGSERLMVWHRWAGFACLWLLVGHAVFTTLGFALSDGSGVVDEIDTLLLTYPWVLMATVALGMLVAVAATSVRAARRRLSYETWFGIHLYAYLGIALAFLHELVVGTDFVNDQVAVGYWVALYVVAVGLLLTFRIAQPIAFSMRHRLVVERVIQEAPGIVSMHLTGRDMDRMRVRAGQYFQFRFLTGGGWWRHHPFSISAAPDGVTLRITVKDLGDDSRRMGRLRPGTRVFVEGPYGAFTREQVRCGKTLLVAGGIGITPLRAMLEERPAGEEDVTLLYRAGTWDDVVFREELEALGRRPGTVVRFLVGHRGSPEMPVDPLEPQWLQYLVPDIAQRDVFYCGSGPFMDHLAASLRTLKVPRKQIHAERFS